MEKDPLCISKHNIFVRVHNFELMFIKWFHEFLIPVWYINKGPDHSGARLDSFGAFLGSR